MKFVRKSGQCFTAFLFASALHLAPAVSAATAAIPANQNPSIVRHALRVGLIDYYPLMSFRGQEPEGILFEYVQDILRSAGLPLEFASVSINRAVEQLRSHQVDLVVSLYKTPERARFVQYSQNPLLFLSQGFCMLTPMRQKPLNAQTRMAFVQGTVVPQSLQHMVLTPVSGDNSQVRMLQMMMKGRVDAVQSPMPGVMILAAHKAGLAIKQNCYELKESRQPLFLAFSKATSREIVQKMEGALQKAVQTEDFDKFLRRRFQMAGIKPPAVEVIDPARLRQGS
jgi:ABC-type amino acid transport substrate-binding protein